MTKRLLTFLFAITSIYSFSQKDIIEELKELHEQEKYDIIIRQHSSKAQEYPALAIYQIGLAYYMKADDNSCLKYMNLSIKKDNTNADPHYIKGMTYNYMGQFNNALKSFTKAIQLNPKNSNYYSGIGDSYFSLDNLEEALVNYETATKLENPTDRPYIMIPQIYARKNLKEKALKSFYTAREKISKETNSYGTVLYNIGLYELLVKNYEKAELVFKEMIILNPNDFQTYTKLIQIYYGKKEYEKAIPYRQKLYKAHKNQKLKDHLEDMFCFDQFDWNGRLVQAFERYEEGTSKLYYKHIFYVYKNDTLEYKLQTENSPVSIELGGPKYIIGMDKDRAHRNFGIGIDENFEYEDLKKTIIYILENKL